MTGDILASVTGSRTLQHVDGKKWKSNHRLSSSQTICSLNYFSEYTDTHNRLDSVELLNQ